MSIYGVSDSLFGYSDIMSFTLNSAVARIAQGYIERDDLTHNEDICRLLYRAVSDVNTLWITWRGEAIDLGRGADWAAVVGSASLMERLAERAARDCLSGLLGTGKLEEAIADTAYKKDLDKALDITFRQELESMEKTLVLLQDPIYTANAPALPVHTAGEPLWKKSPRTHTHYQYDRVTVGAAAVANFLNSSNQEYVLNTGRNVRFHMTEIGRKRRRHSYGETLAPLISSAVRDASHTWAQRCDTYNEIVKKSIGAFLDCEAALVATPKIVQHMHNGSVDSYIDNLTYPFNEDPKKLTQADFYEFYPVENAASVKSELQAAAIYVEFGSNSNKWYVGHGATLSADVWAALHASFKKLVRSPPRAPTVNDADIDRIPVENIDIVEVDDDPASERPAHHSYTLRAKKKIKAVLHEENREIDLDENDRIKINLLPSGAWTRVSFKEEDSSAETTLRFRATSSTEDAIAPVVIGVEVDNGTYRDKNNTFVNALAGWRRMELPLALYKPSEFYYRDYKEVKKIIAGGFEGFLSVSELDGRRVAYAAKRGMNINHATKKVPPPFKTNGPSATYTPVLAWVRCHDGISTLCHVYKSNQMLFRQTELYNLATELFKDTLADHVDGKDAQLRATNQFEDNKDKYAAGIAAAAEIVVATSRTTVYHDSKATKQATSQITKTIYSVLENA